MPEILRLMVVTAWQAARVAPGGLERMLSLPAGPVGLVALAAPAPRVVQVELVDLSTFLGRAG